MAKRQDQKLKQIIYTSKPVAFEEKAIDEILASSHKYNSESGVTGLLIFGSELYMQFLEGPIEELDKTFNRIEIDKRHTEIRILRVSLTDRRLFASWKMRPQDLERMHWSTEEIKNGLVHKFQPDQALDVFEKLSRDLDQFFDPEDA
jgi:hypothetical protein